MAGFGLWLVSFLIGLHGVQKEVAASSGARTVVKKRVTTVSKKVTSVKTEEKKKVFTLAGQKREPPEEVGLDPPVLKLWGSFRKFLRLRKRMRDIRNCKG